MCNEMPIRKIIDDQLGVETMFNKNFIEHERNSYKAGSYIAKYTY